MCVLLFSTSLPSTMLSGGAYSHRRVSKSGQEKESPSWGLRAEILSLADAGSVKHRAAVSNPTTRFLHLRRVETLRRVF